MLNRSLENDKISTKAIKELKKEEILSIKEDRERLSLICKDKVIKLPSNWDGNLLSSNLDEKTVKTKCGKKNTAKIFHTHAIYTAKPSEQDFEGFSKNFPSIKETCIAGVDGVGCYNINNKSETFFYPWKKKELSKDISNIGGKIWEGKHVYCDGKSNVLCEIYVGNKVNQMGIFSKVVMRGGTQIFNREDSDIALNTHLKNEFVQCTAIHGNETLFCEVKNNGKK